MHRQRAEVHGVGAGRACVKPGKMRGAAVDATAALARSPLDRALTLSALWSYTAQSQGTLFDRAHVTSGRCTGRIRYNP